MKGMIRIALWCSLAVLGALLAGTAEAQQEQIYDHEYIERYWADASMTGDVVGGKWRDCCGNWVYFGYVTPYRDSVTSMCGECFPYTCGTWCASYKEGDSSSNERFSSAAAIRRALLTPHGRTPCTKEKI